MQIVRNISDLVQLHSATQVLPAPVLGYREAQDGSRTAELRALLELNANWSGIVEEIAYY